MPLIGSKGCIRCNHTLALWYPMLRRFMDKDLEDLVLHDMGTGNLALLHKIISAWEKIHTKGTDLGRKNYVAKEPYR